MARTLEKVDARIDLQNDLFSLAYLEESEFSSSCLEFIFQCIHRYFSLLLEFKTKGQEDISQMYHGRSVIFAQKFNPTYGPNLVLEHNTSSSVKMLHKSVKVPAH